MPYTRLLRPLLFRLDSETVHERTLDLAEACSRNPVARSVLGSLLGSRHPSLSRERLGLTFPGPVGLAAGFDKNARLVEFASAMGFGFLEVGSVSARPWPGNDRPRIFRLPDDAALINRVGLPSEGAERVAARLARARRRIPVAVNVVKTADPAILGDRAIDDFRTSYGLLAPHADLVVLNVSCPNTHDGRSFEDEGPLGELLSAIREAGAALDRRPPLAVKFSADHERAAFVRILERALAGGAEAFVLTNATRTRPPSRATSPGRIEAIGRGGLTGRPLFELALERVRWAREAVGPGPTIVGVGGIQAPQDARRMLDAGADLLEIYTGLVYRGPGLVRAINRSLARP